MYTYNARVVTVHDGDTLTLDVDLGFFTHVVVPFRILGMNARELSEPGGPEARDHLIELLPVGTSVTITSVKPDKFGGRYDAVISWHNDGGGDVDVAGLLIVNQWAAAWNGLGVKPVPPWPRTLTP